MAFLTEPTAYYKIVPSDLLGAWQVPRNKEKILLVIRNILAQANVGPVLCEQADLVPLKVR